ncbi:MAG: serine/threonine-protein phosphatase [Actinobacteria bacterium]|nr:serine/threonine-protein phosphatase [Actinomycetota bacterium]
MPELSWAAGTDVGRRKKNEDAYVVRGDVFAVADGMGGHARGDVAATMAVEALAGLRERFQRTELLEVIRRVHQEISALAADTGGLGMGTTLTGIGFESERPNVVLVFNVGDSRVYRLRGSELRQLTHDHSVVQELIDAGHITAAEAGSHPDRNVVTRSLGEGGHLEIDWHQEHTRGGDRFLVCSDGLVKEVDEPTIVAVLLESTTADEAVQRLVRTAVEHGGRDNVTVAIVDVAPTDAPALDEDPDIDVDTNPRPPDRSDRDGLLIADTDPGRAGFAGSAAGR